jgi:hypothetical protein
MNDGISITSTAHPISDQPIKRERDAKGRFVRWLTGAKKRGNLIQGEINILVDENGRPISSGGLKVLARGNKLKIGETRNCP